MRPLRPLRKAEREDEMTRSLLLAVTLVLLATGACCAQTFSDVPRGHWAYDAVEKSARLGLVVGPGDGTFKGDRPPTRYELAMGMAKVLAEIENRMKAQPIFTRHVLQELKKLMAELARRIDEVDHNQRYVMYLLEHHYNADHRKTLPDLRAGFTRDVVKRLGGQQPGKTNAVQ